MKYVKSLGFAVVAAMALMAFLGAGSASATRLCSTNTSPCPESWNYFNGTLIYMSLQSSSVLETSGGTVLDTCNEGRLEGPITAFGGATETVKISLIQVGWGNLSSPCTKTTDTLANGELEIHWSGATGNGTITGSGTEWTINTIFGTCVYGFGFNRDLGTITGGNPAAVSINTVVSKMSGNATCPSEARWTANYKVTSPWPLYVVTA